MDVITFTACHEKMTVQRDCLSGDPEASRKEAHLSFPGLQKGAGGLAPESPDLFDLS